MSLLLEQWHQQNPSLLSVASYFIGYHVRYRLLHFLECSLWQRWKEMLIKCILFWLLFLHWKILSYHFQFLYNSCYLSTCFWWFWCIFVGYHKAAIFHSDSRCILSKAFLKSTEFNEIGCWNSRHCSVLLSVKICSEQDRLLLKPACCSLSFKSMESFRRFRSIILSTFPGIDNSVIPLQLLQFDKLPFLVSFTIIPFLHSSGTSWCCHQLFKSNVKESIKHSPPFFNISLVMLYSSLTSLLKFSKLTWSCSSAVSLSKSCNASGWG